MNSEEHLKHYLFLFLGLVVVSVPFVWLVHNYMIQSVAAGAASLLFITWGIIHHVNEGRFQKSVIGEYILFGVIVFFIVVTVLSLF
jgi:hypothetical protein